MAPLVEPAQRPRTARPVPPGHAPAAPGAGGLYRQGAPHHRHATPGGGLCHQAPGNRDRHPDAGDARGRGAPGPGVHPLLQQPAGGDGSDFHPERGGPPHRGQQQVRGGARGAQFHGNRPREGRGPGDPHGRGRPHPHQRPWAASRLLPVGGTGGVLGRHTNVCHGTQPRWETPCGHRRRHQHLHGCHHQPGHGALLRGLGGLRFPEGHGRRRGGHDPHAPPVPAQGGHLPGQRAPPALVPAGKRLGSRHGTPPG